MSRIAGTMGRGLAVPLTLTYRGFTGGLGASRAALRTFERTTNATLRRMSSNFRRFSYMINPLRAAWAGLATAIPVAMLEKLNRAMQQSTAIMGGVSDTMKQKMRQTAIDVSKSTVFYAHQAAQGYFFLASAGLDAQQSLAALPAVAKFAQAGMMELNTATDMLMDAQTAMGLRSNDAAENLRNLTRVMDALTMGNKLSTATVEQMAQGLTRGLGGALRQVNMSVEEGAAMLTIFAERGTKGLEGGQAASIVLRDLQTKSLKNAEAFKKNKLQIWETNGAFRDFGDILADIDEKMAGKSPKERRAFFMDLGFMDRSVRHMVDLVGTSEKYRSNLEAIQKAGGFTEKMAADMLTPFQKSWNEFKGAFQQFTESLAPILDMLTQILGGAAKYLNTQTASAMGGGWSAIVIQTVKTIGDGIQIMIGAVLDFIAEAMVLIGNFRRSKAAKMMGIHWEDSPTGKQDAASWQGRINSMAGMTKAWRSQAWFSNWVAGQMAGTNRGTSLGPLGAAVGARGALGRGLGAVGGAMGGLGQYGGTLGAAFGVGQQRAAAQRTARAQYAAGQALPGFKGLGSAMGMISNAATGMFGRGAGRAGQMFSVNQAARSLAPKTQSAFARSMAFGGNDPLAAAATFMANRRPATAGTRITPPGLMSGLMGLLPTGLMGALGTAGGGLSQMMAIGRRLAIGTPSANAIRAEDPRSREGHAQRVRSLRVAGVDSIARESLKTEKDMLKQLQVIAKKTFAELAPANIAGG